MTDKLDKQKLLDWLEKVVFNEEKHYDAIFQVLKKADKMDRLYSEIRQGNFDAKEKRK